MKLVFVKAYTGNSKDYITKLCVKSIAINQTNTQAFCHLKAKLIFNEAFC